MKIKQLMAKKHYYKSIWWSISSLYLLTIEQKSGKWEKASRNVFSTGFLNVMTPDLLTELLINLSK